MRIEIDVGKNSTTVVGVLNTGYREKEPGLTIPLVVAQQLGLWPHLPETAIEKEYEVAGGHVIRDYVIPNCATVRLLVEKEVIVYNCNIAISEGEKEVLINDKLISALEIVIEDAGKGLWRLRGDDKLMESDEAEEY